LQQQLWDLGRTPVNTIALKKNLIGYKNGEDAQLLLEGFTAAFLSSG
jgi:hypothetical protein